MVLLYVIPRLNVVWSSVKLHWLSLGVRGPHPTTTSRSGYCPLPNSQHPKQLVDTVP